MWLAQLVGPKEGSGRLSRVFLFPSNSPARPPAGGEGRPEARRVIAGRPSSGQ